MSSRTHCPLSRLVVGCGALGFLLVYVGVNRTPRRFPSFRIVSRVLEQSSSCESINIWTKSEDDPSDEMSSFKRYEKPTGQLRRFRGVDRRWYYLRRVSHQNHDDDDDCETSNTKDNANESKNSSDNILNGRDFRRRFQGNRLENLRHEVRHEDHYKHKIDEHHKHQHKHSDDDDDSEDNKSNDDDDDSSEDKKSDDDDDSDDKKYDDDRKRYKKDNSESSSSSGSANVQSGIVTSLSGVSIGNTITIINVGSGGTQTSSGSMDNGPNLTLFGNPNLDGAGRSAITSAAIRAFRASVGCNQFHMSSPVVAGSGSTTFSFSSSGSANSGSTGSEAEDARLVKHNSAVKLEVGRTTWLVFLAIMSVILYLV